MCVFHAQDCHRPLTICFDDNQFKKVINIGHASTVPFSPLRCPSIFWSFCYHAYLLIFLLSFFFAFIFYLLFLHISFTCLIWNIITAKRGRGGARAPSAPLFRCPYNDIYVIIYCPRYPMPVQNVVLWARPPGIWHPKVPVVFWHFSSQTPFLRADTTQGQYSGFCKFCLYVIILVVPWSMLVFHGVL